MGSWVKSIHSAIDTTPVPRILFRLNPAAAGNQHKNLNTHFRKYFSTGDTELQAANGIQTGTISFSVPCVPGGLRLGDPLTVAAIMN
jgi:hypothetical protein